MNRIIILAAVLAWAAAAVSSAYAQVPSRSVAPSSLRGQVVEAGTGVPLAGVQVTMKATSDTADSKAIPARSTLTDNLGLYGFDGVAPGRYVLEVLNVGYRTAQVRVELRRAGVAHVSVGLELEPIVLEPVTVIGASRVPYARDEDRGAPGTALAAAAVHRQRLHLASDVWSLTHAELIGAVTLAESDIFRALQRLPGISTRDDWTAELWLRGAAWDHTRVYFDGLPLFNPLHGGGVLSGVNSDGVGSVYVHPGVRPARLGEGASAIEITSRPAGGTGDIRGFAEVSLASARVAVDRRTPDGRGGWMIAARRTYLDLLSSRLEKWLGVDQAAIPYRFTDVTARIDQPLHAQHSLEASVLWESDLIDGDVPDVVHGSRIVWGNLGLQATLKSELAALRARHTFGITGYGVDVDSIPSSIKDLDADAVGEIHHDVQYIVAKGELHPVAGAWGAGYEAVRQTVRATGEVPPMYRTYITTADEVLDVRQEITSFGAWVDRRWNFGRAEMDTGVRVEGGTPVRNGGSVRLSPRLIARIRPADPLTLTAGVSRSYQYTQVLVPIGSFRAEFPSGHLWLLSDDDTPALRADVGSLGGELWLASAWLVSMTGYFRASDGVVIPDPRPGVTSGRPLFVVVEERGRGLEVAARRLKGKVTGSMAYTLASTDQRFAGLVFPGRSDRRHVVDATALAAIATGLRAGTAFTFATGAPYTRITDLGEDPDGRNVGALGLPNAGRAPAYASLDMMVDWTRSFDTWRFGVFMQIRNVLGRNNVGTYEETVPYCASEIYDSSGGTLTCGPDGSQPVSRDRFLRGMPTVPLLGFRLQF